MHLGFLLMHCAKRYGRRIALFANVVHEDVCDHRRELSLVDVAVSPSAELIVRAWRVTKTYSGIGGSVYLGRSSSW